VLALVGPCPDTDWEAGGDLVDRGGARDMGSAECLVVIDVREDGSDLRAVANVYRPLPGEKIWFSWEDDPSPAKTVVGPISKERPKAANQKAGSGFSLRINVTKIADVVVHVEERTRQHADDGIAQPVVAVGGDQLHAGQAAGGQAAARLGW